MFTSPGPARPPSADITARAVSHRRARLESPPPHREEISFSLFSLRSAGGKAIRESREPGAGASRFLKLGCAHTSEASWYFWALQVTCGQSWMKNTILLQCQAMQVYCGSNSLNPFH